MQRQQTSFVTQIVLYLLQNKFLRKIKHRIMMENLRRTSGGKTTRHESSTSSIQGPKEDSSSCDCFETAHDLVVHKGHNVLHIHSICRSNELDMGHNPLFQTKLGPSNLRLSECVGEDEGHNSRPSCSSPTAMCYLTMKGEDYGQSKSDLEREIDASKVHWSELSSDGSCTNGELSKTNREIFERMRHLPEYNNFFGTILYDVEVGPKIAEGGQAEIFHGTVKLYINDPSVIFHCVLKVFKAGFSLRDLQHQWPQGMTRGGGDFSGFKPDSYSRLSTVWGGVVLEDDRFAFVLQKEHIDLRKLIDVYQDKESLNWGIYTRPFEDFKTYHSQRCRYEWEEGKNGLNAIPIIYNIALGMQHLHQLDILHRDLKASNVLISDVSEWLWVNKCRKQYVGHSRPIRVMLADFECSNGVVGTGFWRAPEILRQLKEKKKVHFTREADVYSFAMTCYEILTGGIPFEECLMNDYDVAFGEMRPTLPKYLPIWLKSLVEECWHPCPTKRPSFDVIVDILERYFELDNCSPSEHIQNHELKMFLFIH